MLTNESEYSNFYGIYLALEPLPIQITNSMITEEEPTAVPESGFNLEEDYNFDLINNFENLFSYKTPEVLKRTNSIILKYSKKYTPSESIKQYIKSTEKYIPYWKMDYNGKPSIGYGFNETPELRRKYPTLISEQDASKEFENIIKDLVEFLEKNTPNWEYLNLNLRDALLSYVYNVGTGSFKNQHPKLLQALKDKNWNAAALQMDAGYNDANNPGLRTRRNYERGLFLKASTSFFNDDIEVVATRLGLMAPINDKIVTWGSSALRSLNANYGSSNSNHKKKDPRTGLAMARDLNIIDGTEKDYDDWINRALSNKEFTDYLSAIGWGFIPEYTKLSRAKYKATGNNIHFGPDSVALRIFNFAMQAPSTFKGSKI